MNALYYGDNLSILKQHIPSESVDLVYLDPPFNSNRNYNLLFKQSADRKRRGKPVADSPMEDSAAQIMAFEDTWTYHPGMFEEFAADPDNGRLLHLMNALKEILGQSEMLAYLLMMAPRLLQLHRVLKPTGSLYLHCDPVASHYLKIVLDVVFGPEHFRNEITWKRTISHNDAVRWFGDVSDTILYYAKDQRRVMFAVQYQPYDEQYVKKFYRHLDENGRTYAVDNLRSPNPRPNLTYDYTASNGVTYKPHANGWTLSLEKMRQFDAEGRLFFPRSPNGRLRVKRYLDQMSGTPVGSVWDDIRPVQSQSAERRGYQTQKPLALLERIIKASSNEGDVVLDPFCGCGTAVIAAERLKRRWIGIDITYLAVAEIISRLSSETDAVRDEHYTVEGTPTDALSARRFFEQTAPQNHKPFEMWAVSLISGQPLEKKGGDRGIDGRLPIYDPKGNLNWAMIQVKGGALNPGYIRDFSHVITREKAVFGVFICLDEPTKQMSNEALEAGFVEGFGAHKIPRLQILTIKELLEEKKRPDFPEGWIPLKYEGVGKPNAVQPTLGI